MLLVALRSFCVFAVILASTMGVAGFVHAADISGIPAVSSARTSEHIYNLPGLSNVGRVAPGVLRGAQPGKEGYATLKAMGIKTVHDSQE